MSGLVYPIGVLILGQEKGEDGSIYPFAHSVTRLTPARWVEPLRIQRKLDVKVETIIVLGPGLIDRIELQSMILYDRNRSQDEDGRLFFAPYRVLSAEHPLIVNVRCSPDLFLFDAPDPLPPPSHEDETIIDYAPGFGRRKDTPSAKGWSNQ